MTRSEEEAGAEAGAAPGPASDAPPRQRDPTTPVALSENLLVEGLGLLLDYLNDGDDAAKLRTLQQRATDWCRMFHRRPNVAVIDAAGHPVSPVPRCILAIHPFVFDLTCAPHRRLYAPVPALTDSTFSGHADTDTDDDAPLPPPPAVNRSFRLPPHNLVDAARYRAKYVARRGATAWFLDDATLDRLVALDDAGREPWERYRAAAQDYGIYDVHIEGRIRASHLRQSPLLWYIPEMMLHLAAMPPLPSFVECLLKRPAPDCVDSERQLRDWEAGGHESRGRRITVSPPPPVPPPSPEMDSPVGMRRAASSKRPHDSSVESEASTSSHSKHSNGEKGEWHTMAFMSG